MSSEKYLYDKVQFWNLPQLLVHGASAINSQNKLEWPEAESARILGWIKGNAGAAGNCVATIEGRIFDKWAIIDTITITASGTNEVTGQKLIDIRGFEELRGSAIYTDVGGKQVEANFYVSSPYK